MTKSRPACPADAVHLSTLLGQLGYPDEVDAVASRLAAPCDSPQHHVLVAETAGRIRIDGVIVLERRLALEQDGYA